MTWRDWLILAAWGWFGINALALALLWRAGQVRNRRAKQLYERFSPQPTMLSAGTIYVDHEPTVSAMRNGGAL